MLINVTPFSIFSQPNIIWNWIKISFLPTKRHLGYLTFPHFLMNCIGHNHCLKNCFQILSSYGIKKFVRAQQDFVMEWTLKKEDVMLVF
uniref:Uncharacterized protein n=1 Tax=Lactuca sativa TaxID=4236 RepID=A0A9R1X889_LACSA|nr:hypothetical protein LSAT_V11C600299920 [Lactuca sativa]